MVDPGSLDARVGRGRGIGVPALGILDPARVLALTAAARWDEKLTRLALYEAPLVVDARAACRSPKNGAASTPRSPPVARGKAVKAFLMSVGVPSVVLAMMRVFPVWKKLTAVAFTLPRDGAPGARPPERGTDPQSALVCGHRSRAGPRRRQEPALDAQRHPRARRRAAVGPLPDARRTNARRVGEGHRARAEGVLRGIAARSVDGIATRAPGPGNHRSWRSSTVGLGGRPEGGTSADRYALSSDARLRHETREEPA